MQFETSWRDRIRASSIATSLALTLCIASPAWADPGSYAAPGCLGAVADTAISLAGDAAGPSAFAALPEDGRDVALRLYVAQNAVAERAEPYQLEPDESRPAPGIAACPLEVAVAIVTSCGSDVSCWTLERISAERHAASGWGQIFHDMYQAGLMDMEKMLSVWKSDQPSADAATTSGDVSSAR